jgi:hypothetical protein
MKHQERRREARLAARGVRARIQPGHRLVVIDVSSLGALVEGSIQLRPGSRVNVQLESDLRRQTLPARVLRCTVAMIDPKAGITYRAALSFGDRCEWVREAMPHEG